MAKKYTLSFVVVQKTVTVMCCSSGGCIIFVFFFLLLMKYFIFIIFLSVNEACQSRVAFFLVHKEINKIKIIQSVP